jgi:hypothetical protein
VPFRIEQDILRLQIPVRDPFLLVQELQNKYNLSNVKTCRILIEAFSSAQIGKDLAARTIVELLLH